MQISGGWGRAERVTGRIVHVLMTLFLKTTMFILIMLHSSQALFPISGHLTPDTSALFFLFAPWPCPFSCLCQHLELTRLGTVLARVTRARACANRN